MKTLQSTWNFLGLGLKVDKEIKIRSDLKKLNKLKWVIFLCYINVMKLQYLLKSYFFDQDPSSQHYPWRFDRGHLGSWFYCFLKHMFGNRCSLDHAVEVKNHVTDRCRYDCYLKSILTFAYSKMYTRKNFIYVHLSLIPTLNLITLFVTVGPKVLTQISQTLVVCDCRCIFTTDDSLYI